MILNCPICTKQLSREDIDPKYLIVGETRFTLKCLDCVYPSRTASRVHILYRDDAELLQMWADIPGSFKINSTESYTKISLNDEVICELNFTIPLPQPFNQETILSKIKLLLTFQ